MKDKIGIDELLTLVQCVAKIGTSSWEILEDGKINFKDAGEVWEIIQSMHCMASVDFRKSMAEWSDLDYTERGQLVEAFREGFEGPIEDIEALVETLVGIAVDLYSLIRKLVLAFKN